MNKTIGRILDANLNRAREGLRVAEEIARMIIEHEPLQKKLKAIRHQLIITEKKMSSKSLLDQRSAQDDPGSKNTHKNESHRGSLQELGRANLRRCQEACRVLEEFSKLESPSISKTFKKIRFQAYELESELIRLLDRASMKKKNNAFVRCGK